MKKNTVRGLLFAGVIMVLCLCTSLASAEVGIKWYKYAEGIDKARIEGKKIYINFYADWCYYCKVMEKTSFKDSSVISYLNDNFIAIRVDTVKEKKLANDYKIQGLPASWFLESNGGEIGLKPGYLEPGVLLENLKFVYDEKYKPKK